MSHSTEIQAWFGSKRVPRAEVLEWETKRATKNLRKLGQPVPTGDIRVLRTALLDARLALGRTGIEERLAREIKLSDRVTGAIAKASGRHRRVSQVELFAPGVKASLLPDWYLAKAEADDESAFLAACPDHHLFRPIEDPRGQEVWETTGGSPMASRFFFELEATDGLVTPADTNYPIQMAGVARLANGTVIGGIRHQFRDEADGARALLTVELPWLIGPVAPAAHRWHLACEFSAWIEASAKPGTP
ncbi:MAG: hypothetical protein Q4G21_04070 [Dermabacter sp.]|nr:hypothetical protein [Dermabacter sp.]